MQSPDLPAFCSHQYVFVVVFSSPEYLTDLQGRSVDDPGLYWDFYGSSVCGEQMLPFISLYAETLKTWGTWGWGLFCSCGGGSWEGSKLILFTDHVIGGKKSKTCNSLFIADLAPLFNFI